MQGSRHEKAAIVVASYVIGFVTAFILYGVHTESPLLRVPLGDESGAAVVTAPSAPVAPVVASEPAKAPTLDSEVSYKDGVLEIKVGDTVNILSFNPVESKIEADTAELSQGFHYGELAYTVSEDGKFVFFCEQHNEDDESCVAYVYDVQADRIYPVTMNGEAVTITLAEAVDVIWTALGLKVNLNFSANPKAPWVLIGAE